MDHFPFSQNGGIPFSDGFTISGTPVMEQTQNLVPRRMMPQTQSLVPRVVMQQTQNLVPRVVMPQTQNLVPMVMMPQTQNLVPMVMMPQTWIDETRDPSVNNFVFAPCIVIQNRIPDVNEHPTQGRNFHRDEYDGPCACCDPRRRRPNGCLVDARDRFLREVYDEFTERRRYPPPHRQFPEESRLRDYEYDDYDQTPVVQGRNLNCRDTIRYGYDYFQDPVPPAPSFQQIIITKEIVRRSNCDCENCTHGVRRKESKTLHGSQERVPITTGGRGKSDRKISVPTGDHHRTASQTVSNPGEEDERKAPYEDHPGRAENDNSYSYPYPGDVHRKPIIEYGTGEEGQHEISDDPSVTVGDPLEEDPDRNRGVPEEDSGYQTLDPHELPEEETEVAHNSQDDEPSPNDEPEVETPEVENSGDEMSSDTMLPGSHLQTPEGSKKGRRTSIGSFLGNKISGAAGQAAERGKGVIESLAGKMGRKHQEAIDRATNEAQKIASAGNEKASEIAGRFKDASKTKAQDLKKKAEGKAGKMKTGMKNKIDDFKKSAKEKGDKVNERMGRLASSLKKSFPKIKNPFKKKKK